MLCLIEYREFTCGRPRLKPFCPKQSLGMDLTICNALEQFLLADWTVLQSVRVGIEPIRAVHAGAPRAARCAAAYISGSYPMIMTLPNRRAGARMVPCGPSIFISSSAACSAL